MKLLPRFRHIAIFITKSYVFAVCCLLAGCGHSPTLNIMGSFFPAWLLCLVCGVIAATAVNWLFSRKQWNDEIPLKVVVYPCLALLIAFIVWLLLFD